ncbi:hypothetical protein LWI28_006835 [Acer negundo]|uniref:Cullin N-terminal domain-containing protein n=1 Tax=Acer negundo TaxID=4023 RepID=A0AAD5NW17_ACENE|nr:hypothetical protein LWI28_006835 [Acer negundo]
MMSKDIPIEEGLIITEEAIGKAKKIMKGCPETKFTFEEYQKYYECVYFMCNYHNTYEKTMQLCMQLYNQFKRSLEESINTVVVPSLMCQDDDAYLLRQLVLMWSNYKLMARWLCQFFQYLDQYFIPRDNLLSLDELTVSCFQDLVFKKFYCQFQAAALSLINQEREGLQIDCDLLKNVIHTFVELGKYGQTKYYEDFEQAMLVDTSALYTRLASEWLLHDSTADYVQKVYWCLSQENGRASHYLHPRTAEMLRQIVRNQLLEQPANKLFEKKQAENSGITTDYQKMLSKCAGMTLEEGSSVSATEEWLAALMASSINIC